MFRAVPQLLLAIAALSPALARAADEIFIDGFQETFINEIVNDSVEGDAVEFFNKTIAAVDFSGWYFTDDDPQHVYTFPSGSVLTAGAYIVIQGVDLPFGLGSADSVYLYSSDSSLHDRYVWQNSATSPGSHSRCPNGTGAFTIAAASSLGSTNVCP